MDASFHAFEKEVEDWHWWYRVPLDILEHLDDDEAAARELVRVCKPGGHVVAYVPAFAFLWGYNDDYSHHKRRYVKRELSALLARAGLGIEESGYFNATLFLPTLA